MVSFSRIGERTYPSIACATAITGMTSRMNAGGLVSNATIATGIPPIHVPSIGIRFATPTTAPRTSQKGMWIAHSPIVASTPTTADTIKRALR